MKVILTILCGLMIMFAGGCALVVGRDFGLASLVLLGVVALNALLIAAMYGFAGAMRPVFYVLIAADVIVALGVVILAATAAPNDAATMQVALAIAAGFLAKGGLSFGVLRGLGRS